MNAETKTTGHEDPLQSLKTTASIVYLCQVFTFVFAGLPLLIGVAINLMKRPEVKGTWLESHFNWQIKTVWITLAGFAIAGLTFPVGVGLYILIVTLVYLVYRIAIGWSALYDNKAVKED